MAFADLVKFIPAAGGTADWVYSSVVGGCQSPSAANVRSGLPYRVNAVSSDLTQWEVSEGINVSGTTFPRTKVLYNSSGTGTAPGQTGAGSKINFTTVPQVFVTLLAEDIASAYAIQPCIRLTLTQGTAVTTSDVTGATSLCLEPYNGDVLPLFDGISWIALTVPPSTVSLPATQTQTGTLNGTTAVTGLSDTSQIPSSGVQVTGTNVPANTTFMPTGTTTGTLSNAATGSGATSLTFKLPPTTNFDAYGIISATGTVKMIWSAAWSNDTTPPTRALQNGILVAAANPALRLLGSIRTTATAGLLEDSEVHCWVSNLYNPQPRSINVVDTTATWTYSTQAWRQANANAANQADVIFCVPGGMEVSVAHLFSNSTTTVRNAETGIGLDRTSQSDACTSVAGASSTVGGTAILSAKYVGVPGIGRHILTWLENASGFDIQTFYGNASTTDGRFQTGLVGWTLH